MGWPIEDTTYTPLSGTKHDRGFRQHGYPAQLSSQNNAHTGQFTLALPGGKSFGPDFLPNVAEDFIVTNACIYGSQIHKSIFNRPGNWCKPEGTTGCTDARTRAPIAHPGGVAGDLRNSNLDCCSKRLDDCVSTIERMIMVCMEGFFR